MIIAGLTIMGAGAVIAIWNLTEGNEVLFCLSHACLILGMALFGAAMLIGGAA